VSLDALGDRMKRYEAAEAGRRLMPLLPVLARIDGRGFSKFTQGLQRPFDARLSGLMVDTTRFLVQETGARVGYTQSDEITLLWQSSHAKEQVFFDGRIQKMVSVLAAMTSVAFYRGVVDVLPGYAARQPVFDCRVWQVPTQEEGANAFLWRERDATKNSISMAARAHFTHEQLLSKSGTEMQDMLHGIGINWNDYPAFFKRGTYVQRRLVRHRFSTEDISELPPQHLARRQPDHEFERPEIQGLEVPPLGRVTNRVAMLFDGDEPLRAPA